MIDCDHDVLSITEQCRLLSIPRSTFYNALGGKTAETLALMRQIDEQFLETPFYGVRQMTWHLRAEGECVHRDNQDENDASFRMRGSLGVGIAGRA